MLIMRTPFYLQYWLQNFLINRMPFSHGFAEAADKEQFAKQTNQTMEEVERVCEQLDEWSDKQRIPSLTCLFRPAVTNIDNMVYADIHTALLKKVGKKFPRKDLKMELLEEEVKLTAIEGSGFKGEITIPIHPAGIISNKDVLERDLVITYYQDLIGI